MNRNNKESKLHQARAGIKGLGSKIATGSALALVAVGNAMAQATTGPDVSAIEDKITTYGGVAAGLIIALCVVLWTLKATGLLKPR